MENLVAVLGHPEEFYPLLKLKRAVKDAEKLKQFPSKPHWAFCYAILHRVSTKFPLVIQHLDADLRNAVSLHIVINIISYNHVLYG